MVGLQAAMLAVASVLADVLAKALVARSATVGCDQRCGETLVRSKLVESSRDFA